LLGKLFKKKNSVVWLQVPTDHKTRAEALECYEAVTEMLEQILLNK